MLRFLTAGESHGQALVVILEGVPAGLHRRRRRDRARPARAARAATAAAAAWRSNRIAPRSSSGVRAGETLGGPIALLIENRDWANWQHTMSVDAEAPPDGAAAPAAPPVTRPRPGHADLAGGAQVRARRPARRPRARQRARDRRARGRRRHRRASCSRHVGIRSDQPRVRRSAASALADRAHGRLRRAPAPLPDDAPLRCVDPALEQRDDRRDRSRRARPATRSAARSRSSRTACRSASAATCSGIASSTAGSRRR